MAVEQNGMGGFDLHMTLPGLDVGQWVDVICNSAFTEADLGVPEPQATIRLEKSAGGLLARLLDTSGALIEAYEILQVGGAALWVRVRVYDEAVSLSIDGGWAATLWLAAVRHAETTNIKLAASTQLTVQEITLVELADGQDQVTVDIEASSANAISSVTSRRPIRQWALEDGAVAFAYSPPRETVEANWAASIEQVESSPERAASDGIVYHEEITIVSDEQALREIGFVTHTFRFSNLRHGAITASRKMLEMGRQERKRTTITRALMPHLEAMDRLQCAFGIGDGIKTVDEAILVEEISLTIAGGQAACTITGRAE